MHIKTNIEHSLVQIVVLAICPLITVTSGVSDALFFVCGTLICMIVSQLFCLIFNKYLSNNVKSMLTALISSMIVVIVTVFTKGKETFVVPENAYFVIFSTTILSAEFIYFRNKALTKHYFLHILKTSAIFAIMLVIFSAVKEFLSVGMLYGKKLTSFAGVSFFGTIVFDLILLASLCFIFDLIVRAIDKKFETKNMVYQKYVKIIRREKAFQYDLLRREKLLTNEIEVNNINKTDAEKIVQKESENEAIESVQEVVAEETEVLETETADDAEKTDGDDKPSKKDKKEDKK